MDINAIMKELAQYNRIAEETAAVIEGLKDKLKVYMVENNLDTLNGDEHKATYKEVINNRIDTTALKAELPDIAKKYTKSTPSMRFNFS
jgi:predicted phage-related endonuclease